MLERINALLWGKMMIVLLVILGLKLLFATRFYLFRKAKSVFRLTFGDKKQNASPDAPSPFRTLCAALGGTIGVGNTVGVAAAIAVGGPGSVLWMVLSGFLAMMIKFCEIWLSSVCKDYALGFGGPMHYMKALLHSPGLALFFSLSVLPASLFVGNLAQSNMVCGSMETIFGVPRLITGLVFALAVGLVIFGGAKRITDCCTVVVPLMSVAYLALCLMMILRNAERLPGALSAIFTASFTPAAALGGVGGYGFSRAISCGFSKGMFSNEAGMGSAPMAHTQSGETDPEKQAAWGIVEVFIDTVVICLLTALVILTCPRESGDVLGTVLGCFTDCFGKPGEIFFALSMIFFAFASICAWNLYAECAIRALSENRFFLTLFRLIFALTVPLGAILSTRGIIAWADLFNALMALPNILAMLVISGMKPIRERWKRL